MQINQLNSLQEESLKGSELLRKSLPHGAISLLAIKYGKSWTWIYNVVSGKAAGNPEIIRDALSLQKIHHETLKAVQKITEKIERV